MGEAICVLPFCRQVLAPTGGFLVVKAIHVLPGKWGRSRHPLTDFLVVDTLHTLLGQHGQAPAPTGRRPSSESYLCAPRKVGQVLPPTDGFPSHGSSSHPPRTAWASLGAFWQNS